MENINQLLEIMQQLRDPESGCPWDKKQNYQSLLPYTIEEVYEVVDAIERNDFEDLKDELGDLLFQIVFYTQLAKEDKRFNFDDVVQNVCDKMLRRHPHVFDNKKYENEESLHLAWEQQKHQERQTKLEQAKLKQSKSKQGEASLLDNIPKVLPELKRSQKMQKRAAKQGFDWPDVEQVWDKLKEESLEVQEAVESGDTQHIEEEIGDLLFVCVNLARHYKVDADNALRTANNKFDKRFRDVEAMASHRIADFSLEELEVFWQKAKLS